MSEKSIGEKLQKELLMKPENATTTMTDEQLSKASEFCEGYKTFLDKGKTEREVVDYTVEILKDKGFEEYDPSKKYAAGAKVYLNNRGKALVFAVIGKKSMASGAKIIASHVDCPRIDLKPRPLYEEGQIALFKTHYYGGIKKYQWAAIPLSLHGVIIKKDGTKVKVNIGENEADPQFCITDLLPHLAKEQMERKLKEGIKGEELNILVGSRMFRDDKASEKVKLNIMKMLNEKYAIVESDFLSAELCVVPAFKARDIGFDRSMLGSYGHDDRVCAYTSLMGCLDNLTPEYTWVNVFADKEEVGSAGNTGLKSSFLEYFIKDLAESQDVNGRHALSRSQCLSADVNVAFDPTFSDVTEKRNTSYINYGVVIAKYTGSGGKGGTNDANAEFMAELRQLYDGTGVIWQTGELGKVDMGGGGTVAQYVANLDVEVIDVGVPVLSMHAPLEVVAKTDVYMTYRAFAEFAGQK